MGQQPKKEEEASASVGTRDSKAQILRAEEIAGNGIYRPIDTFVDRLNDGQPGNPGVNAANPHPALRGNHRSTSRRGGR